MEILLGNSAGLFLTMPPWLLFSLGANAVVLMLAVIRLRSFQGQ